MYSEITQEKPRQVRHKVNHKELVPSKSVNIWRGLSRKIYKYILTNRYYDDKILVRNELDFMIDLRRGKFPKTTMSIEKVAEYKASLVEVK